MKSENEYGTFYIEDGILYFICKEGVQLGLPAADIITNDILEIENGKKYPLCVDITRIGSADKAYRDIMAVRADKFATRMAFVANSTISRSIGNFYLFISKPIVPARIFATMDEAVQYLKSFSTK
jgi:hypothetical protein